jgi:hypothetical protein
MDPQPPSLPSPDSPLPAAAAMLRLAEPFSAAELGAALRRPSRSFEVVLAGDGRLAASIAAQSAPWRLVAVLAACASVAAVPYGLVRGADAWWRIAALYAGSVLLCVPSLQVFGTFLGSRLQPVQSLALSLLIASIAALFTLGFFPIVWFLGRTMHAGDWITDDSASVALLLVAYVAGLAGFVRCATGASSLLPARGALPPLLVWLCLVTFVTQRMARELGLLG